jgi:Predicted membrane protein (DUF2306)
MKKLSLGTIAFLSVAVAGYAIYAYTALPVGTTVAPGIKETFQRHQTRVLLHVIFSAVALLTGPWQFFAGIRRRAAVHRALGYVYFSSVFGGGIAGLALAFLAYGGLVSRVGFGALAVAWLFSATQALLAIRRKQYAEHERWAVRCFALTFAAVMLRLYLGLFFAAGFAFDDFYPLLSWLCWVPNLVFVEWVLFGKRDAPALSPPQSR